MTDPNRVLIFDTCGYQKVDTPWSIRTRSKVRLKKSRSPGPRAT
jgi:hypothetical protein